MCSMINGWNHCCKRFNYFRVTQILLSCLRLLCNALLIVELKCFHAIHCLPSLRGEQALQSVASFHNSTFGLQSITSC